MKRPSLEDGHVRMPEDEFEELMELAAERGPNVPLSFQHRGIYQKFRGIVSPSHRQR